MSHRLFTRIERALINLFVVLVCIYLLAPLFILVIVSFQHAMYLAFPVEQYSLKWWTQAVIRPEWRIAMWMSIKLALQATLVSLISGLLAGLAIHYHDFKGKQVLRTFFMSPLLMPQVLTGIALLFFFAARKLSGSYISLLLGHVLICSPYVVQLMLAALPGVSRSQEEAAMTLGANEFTTLMKVTLPLVGPAIRGGAIFAFMASYNNVLVSLFLAIPRLIPVPVKILQHLEWTAEPTLAAVSVVFMALTFALVLIAEKTVGIELMPGSQAVER